jgi:isoquinoline 1-oxidoreductase beta subunit
VVINPGSGQRLSYGEIAAFGTIPATLPAIDAKELKDRKQFRLIGRSVPRRDTPSKVNGSAQYAIDVKLPGMVYASTLHSPVHNAQPQVWNPGKQDQTGVVPESWNEAQVKAMKGVIGIIALPNGLAGGAQPAYRAARDLPRHQAQALARRRPCIQHLRHRELRRSDGGRSEG